MQARVLATPDRRPGRGGNAVGRELAAVARPGDERHQHREGAAGEVVDRRENIAWKLAMPSRSGATPIIWNDTHLPERRHRATAAGDLELWALNRNDGKRRCGSGRIAGGNHIERKQNMSSPSPVTDGKTVWVMTGVGVLKAFDFNGKELWARDIQKDYGEFGLNWGYASSPLLHGGDALRAGAARHEDRRSVVRAADRRQDGQDRLAGRAADRRAIIESPDAYTTPALLQSRRQKDRDRHHRRRRRDRPRSCDRQGAVADARPQSAEQSATTASSPRRSWSATS